MRRLAVLLAVTSLALAIAPAASAQDSKVSYKPPAPGPVVDPFRPPPEPWLAGNRGIDYHPGAGTPIKASADGEVVFAGQVGGDLHAVVLHPDGIRTSYSFLQSLAVHRGDKVSQGDVVGTSSDSFHFGARVGEEYIDPRTLFDDGPPRVFLVPDDQKRPGTEAAERGGLIRFLRKAVPKVWPGAPEPPQWVSDVLGTSWQEIKGLAHWNEQQNLVLQAVRLGTAAADWWNQRKDCTPAGVEPPPLPEPRVAVLVAGLGSNSGKDSVDAVGAKGMGYQDDFRFSYNGGTTKHNPYGPEDTTVDLRTQAERLNEVLKEVARKHPGVPVDIIAHSQGGLIARAALAYEYDRNDPELPRVASLVTLASPHQGSDAATAADMLGATTSGAYGLSGLHATGASKVDLQGPSIAQMSETSDFIRNLNNTPLPEGINFTSIGSSGDLTVAGNRTKAPGAENVMVSLPGLGWSELTGDHSNLPGSPQGRREVALAVAGRPPTCQSLGDMLVDQFLSQAISHQEDMAAAAAYLNLRRLDRRIP